MIGRSISHYTIQSLVGVGSMGEVYRALDERLRRPVALKFMLPAVARDASAARRFLQEARAASALDHANICTIYEAGDTDDGLLYLAMAFYEGETLAAKIARGPLTLEQIGSIARQVALGLGRAHQYGIVHRDVKPANVFVTQFGEVKLLDFGLAKLRGEVTLTDRGELLGTIPYMAPEQASSGPVDHRTDIWAFGVVLYEMLAGRRPFSGDTVPAVLAAILYEDPPPLHALRSDAPAAVLDIVEHALCKAPEGRPQSCQAIARILAGEESVTAGLARERRAIEPIRRCVMVMPFVALAGDTECEHFGHGLADELTTALSQVRSLRVMARTAAERVHASGRNLHAAARELGVEYVVAGAVRRQGPMLRVSANLIEAKGGTLVWAEQFSGGLEDLFLIQEQLSRKIADALEVQLVTRHAPAEPRLDDVKSYDYYLRAKREFVRYEPGGLERALAFIESARARTGDNALLLAAAGQIFWQLVNSGATPDRTYLDRARQCADRLMEIEPSGPHGPRLLGMVRLLEGRIRDTIALLQTAVDRDPNDTDALSLLGPCYGYVGLPQAGRPVVERLLELDPLTPMYQAMPGYLYLMAGSFEKALDPFARSYTMDPGNPLVGLSYGQALAFNERTADAIDVFEELQRRTPNGFMARLGQMYKHGLLRQRERALAWLTPEMEVIADGDLYHAWNLAECCALVQDGDRALYWLERATTLGMLNYPLLAALDPFLESVRSHPDFDRIMAAVRRHWEEITTELGAWELRMHS